MALRRKTRYVIGAAMGAVAVVNVLSQSFAGLNDREEEEKLAHLEFNVGFFDPNPNWIPGCEDGVWTEDGHPFIEIATRRL